MANGLVLALLFLLLGLILGVLLGWVFTKMRLQSGLISPLELKNKYVLKELHEALQDQSGQYREELREKAEEIKQLSKGLSSQEQIALHLEEKLNGQKKELESIQKRFQTEFENIANRLLDEKSRKFSSTNQKELNDILTPLREKIKAFEEGIEKRYLEETKDRVSLKKEIEQLRELNLQLSQDANNLANALKGENKTQGDWGEFQLEMLLQHAGLTKDVHYLVQANFQDEEGRQKRPDFIINLPEGKHLIIDSKVSLLAYEKYFNAQKVKKREKFLKDHIDSIRQHIRELGNKNYQQLYQLNSPDYLLLFVPIEPAFAVALQKDSRLFLDALDRNIVLVTTSTLLATMRTVSYIWKQEKQKRSVLEIARQSGMLYDKFCNFVDDLKSIGQRLNLAQNAYHDAMNKLVDSKKYGDTLIGRAQKIKELGAKTSKSLPRDMLETIGEEEE